MSILKYWNGSAWTLVPDGTAFKYWNGSSWVNPNFVKYWNGSSWATAWSKTDPVTYTYYAGYSNNLRNGTSNAFTTTSDPSSAYIGAFAGTYPYHFASIVSLGDPTDGNSSHNASTVIATRPVIKSISLRLTRQSTTGTSGPTGSLYIGSLSYPVASWGSGTMSTISSTFDWSPVVTHDVSGWGFSTTRTIDLNVQHGYDMINSSRGLLLGGTTGSYTTSVGSSTGNYMKFEGYNAGTSVRPMFTVTFDYA